MRVDSLAAAAGPAGPAATTKALPVGDKVASRPDAGSFGDLLGETASTIAGLEAAADRAAQRVATGDLAHLHEAVIALQEASLALDFVIQVRNHVLDGIQELLRTQV